MIEPENTASPGLRVAGRDSPVKADWSTSTGSPSSRARIRGDDVAQPHTDDVARHQLARLGLIHFRPASPGP